MTMTIRDDKDEILGRSYNVIYSVTRNEKEKLYQFSNILVNVGDGYFYFSSKEDGLDVVKQDFIISISCVFDVRNKELNHGIFWKIGLI